MLLTLEDFVTRVGEEECLQIAGKGARDMRELDAARIETELDAAAGVVAGYVLARYPFAIDAPPEMLKGYAADIARWRLRGRGGQQSAMAEVVKQRYDEAIKALRDIAAGKLALDLGAPGVGPADASAAGANTAFHASFPPSRVARIMEGW